MRLKKNLINKYKIILFIFLNYLLYQNNIIIYRQEIKVKECHLYYLKKYFKIKTIKYY